MAHIMALHEVKSSNPLGTNDKVDFVPFHPYFTTKDAYGIVLVLTILLYVVCFDPGIFAEPDNSIEANPMMTPAHILPSWYLLVFFEILRVIPNKPIGAIAMIGSLAILYLLPLLNTSEIRSGAFRPIFKFFFWIFVANALLLGWLGMQHVVEPYLTLGRIATAYYFGFFVIILPLTGILENALMRNRIE